MLGVSVGRSLICGASLRQVNYTVMRAPDVDRLVTIFARALIKGIGKEERYGVQSLRRLADVP